MSMLRGGRCWKLPDQVSSDQLIGSHLAFEFDPQILRKHLLAELRPELAAEAQSGDCLVAGKNFAHGSVHSHPFLAMQAMGLSLITRSMPRGGFRLAVFMGIPMLTADEALYDGVNDGDRLEIDFAAGRVSNVTNGLAFCVQPLAPFLYDIVASGGGLNYVKRLVKEQPA
jgi:3-isopropylmalate/(R)-2-methylmalate dehydratase small subunit